MKQLYKNLGSDGQGQIKLLPEEDEDLWEAYNLIMEGDQVKAPTFRKVSKESGTGQSTERVQLTITIKVERVDFDPEDGELRLKGRNMTNSEYIQLGQYHTLQLEVSRPFTIEKAHWDGIDLARIREACNPVAKADLAVLMITEGLAQMILIGGNSTLVRAKVETNLPRKRGPAIAGYEKAWGKFLSNVLQSVVRHVNFSIVRCLVIAGPGFAKDEFKKYLLAEAIKQELRAVMDNKERIFLAHASTAYKHSLKEVLENEGIASKIADTKAVKEIKVLQQFNVLLANQPAKTFYGPGHVFAAHESGAIDKLLISDKFLRVKDVKKRKRLVRMIREAKDGGGEVLIFSSLHVSGKQLDLLTGIAAILRFPMPELEEQELVVEW